jgi:hypothetical protein
MAKYLQGISLNPKSRLTGDDLAPQQPPEQAKNHSDTLHLSAQASNFNSLSI